MGRPPNGVNEIIEIGALRFNAFGEELGRFNEFIKPTVNPLLSPFCRKLTKINQSDIDTARTYPYVIRDFLEWGEIEEEDTYLISWGENDKKFFKDDCYLHKIDADWAEKHVNLKPYHRELKKLNNGVGLKKAVQMEGFEFTGISHRGIDDAINLARVFVKHIDEWSFI